MRSRSHQMKIEYKVLSQTEMEDLPPEAHPQIRVRLLDMTLEKKKYLFQEFSAETDSQLDAWVAGVERILHQYSYWNYLNRTFGTVDLSTSKVAREMYLSLHDHLRAAHRILSVFDDRSLDDLVAGAEEFDEDIQDQLDIGEFRHQANVLSRAAKQGADEIQPSRGRPPRDDLLEALLSLGCFYERETGQQPGYSSRPEKRPGARGRDVYGPFVRFATRILQIVEPSQSAIDNAVRRYVRQLPRNRQNLKSVEK